MDHKKIQKDVNDLFTEAFVHTPLTKRLQDIEGECREVCNFTNLTNLREETGDLLASIIQLCSESGWDIEEILAENNAKIKSRMLQYKSLGRKTQVAILGGAFNPVTKGHIDLAKLVLNASKWADEVWFMPSYNHLDGKVMVAPEHRLAMLQEAVKNDGRLKVSDYEIKHEMGGETYHLLNKMIHDPEYKDKYRFAFIIGQDRADTIETWYNSDELLKMDVPFIIAPRAGIDKDPKVNWYLQKPHMYLANDNIDDVIMPTSSTEAREKLYRFNHTHDMEYMRSLARELGEILPEMVFEYTGTHTLYK